METAQERYEKHKPLKLTVAPEQPERIASNRPLQRCSAATAGGSVDGQSSGRNTSGVQPDVTAGGLVSLRQCSCAVQ